MQEQSMSPVRHGSFSLPDEFVNLYVGADFCQMAAGGGPLQDAYIGAEEQRLALYQALQHEYQAVGGAEFTFRPSPGLNLRATCVRVVDGTPIFILRRFRRIPEIHELGLRTELIDFLMRPDLTGLVIIAGQQASGKTSTAASLLRERLRRHGGVAAAVEDPVETDLLGVHGAGRCLQFVASAANGGYPEQIKISLRTGALLTLIGEVRDPVAAEQAVNAGINGHLILTTVHGGGITEAIERVCSLAGRAMEQRDSANSIVAHGLTAVIHQELLSGAGSTMVISRGLYLHGTEQAVRDRIRKGEFSALEGEIDRRANELTWGNG
ncbi:ATPase, T2SS/T4P/T4SS family [Billgrantia desiderata]|uniref:ATPase, T2SS/T4P/T4SS family n=1 Tax=Billgrantia desiderata TaxID=52021 RepID=UPI00089ECC64|nr:ATPase, T2SS/T4P/T4SS family [Halomonas desiderata]SEG30525.1 twitching motility protein PilT [Halomonas desiderata]